MVAWRKENGVDGPWVWGSCLLCFQLWGWELNTCSGARILLLFVSGSPEVSWLRSGFWISLLSSPGPGVGLFSVSGLLFEYVVSTSLSSSVWGAAVFLWLLSWNSEAWFITICVLLTCQYHLPPKSLGMIVFVYKWKKWGSEKPSGVFSEKPGWYCKSLKEVSSPFNLQRWFINFNSLPRTMPSGHRPFLTFTRQACVIQSSACGNLFSRH